MSDSDLSHEIWTRDDGLVFLPREADDSADQDPRPKRQYLCRIVPEEERCLPTIYWLDRYRTGRRAARQEEVIPYEIAQPLDDFLRKVAKICGVSEGELVDRIRFALAS